MGNNFYEKLKNCLVDYKNGKITESEIFNFIKKAEFEDIGFAKIDHKRAIFKNFPEVIFGIGKSDGQIIEIFEKMAAHGGNVMATRVSTNVYKEVKKIYPDVTYIPHSMLLFLRQGEQPVPKGKVVVMTAGTADLKAAEEAAMVAELSGSHVTRVYDVGVAGIKRLFNNISHIFDARVIIVAAGMEGALASVVGGLASVPVIALPTSVGYGSSFNGIAALLSMLNCCSPGVSVVNIDNGFGAGYLASQINLQAENALLKIENAVNISPNIFNDKLEENPKKIKISKKMPDAANKSLKTRRKK